MSDSFNNLFSIINSKKYNNVILIFGINTCPFCLNSINDLHKYGIPYKFFDIKNNYKNFFSNLQEISKKYKNLISLQNHKTVPVIFFNSKFIGGYSQLSAFF